jgi:hypothetical protein
LIVDLKRCKAKVKHVILIGEASEKIAEAIGQVHSRAESMEGDAVKGPMLGLPAM